jgi:hypothetical protein
VTKINLILKIKIINLILKMYTAKRAAPTREGGTIVMLKFIVRKSICTLVFALRNTSEARMT